MALNCLRLSRFLRLPSIRKSTDFTLMNTWPLPTLRWRFLTALTSSFATIRSPAGTQFFGETSVRTVVPTFVEVFFVGPV